MTGNINFFNEKTTQRISRKRILKSWIFNVVQSEKLIPGNINIIFCDDNFLLGLNKEYFKRSTLTDIITFSFSESKREVSGDIYISLPRVKENAEKFRVPFSTEISRVIIHGILHLAGYDDRSKEEKMEMRYREDIYLKKLEKSLYNVI